VKLRFDPAFQRLCLDYCMVPHPLDGYWLAVMSVDTWLVDYL